MVPVPDSPDARRAEPRITRLARFFVVRRGESVIFESFRKDFEDGGLASVIWDRRIGERRLERRTVAVERRRGDRRGPLPRTWSTLGFVLVPSAPLAGSS